MNKQKRSYLEQTFGTRVTLDERKRLLYSHDIGAVPSLIKPLIGDVWPLLIDCLQSRKPA